MLNGLNTAHLGKAGFEEGSNTASKPINSSFLGLDELITLCKEKNRKAQSELFLRFKDRIFALCLKYCKNLPEAEDNLQDSFIKIFQNIDKYNGKGSFEGWMKRIAINNAIDRYKKELYIQPIDEQRTSEQDNDTNIENDIKLPLAQLLALIQELPSRYRLVFNMYQLDGYSHKEISEILSISLGTSKSNLHRAKLILKEKIVNLTSDNLNHTLKHG